VKVGRTYKLKASAALRVGPQLDSPRTGMLESGERITVKAIKTLPCGDSGAGKEVVRLCCAAGRGWVSLRAKNGQELFHAGCCQAGLKPEQVTVGASYRVRSIAAVRRRAELSSTPADVEFLYPGDWMTVGEIRVLSAEASGTGEEVMRLRCKDGRGWVSLRAKDGHELFDANASALDGSDDTSDATEYNREDEDFGSDADENEDEDEEEQEEEADSVDSSRDTNMSDKQVEDKLLGPEAILGSVAVLQDMLSNAGAKLNGSVVTVVGYDGSTDRYGVRFQDGSHKAVRLRNLGPPPFHHHKGKHKIDSDGGSNGEQLRGDNTGDKEDLAAESCDGDYGGGDDDDDDDSGGSGDNEDDDNPEIDTECTTDGEYTTVGRAPRHVLRYRVVANKAVIRAGMEISSEQVGELNEGDIVDGWEEMVTDEGHTRLRISENEWVSRITARGKILLQSEKTMTAPTLPFLVGLFRVVVCKKVYQSDLMHQPAAIAPA
jgi:hypothetical protein